jgi:hypothetical protein
VGDKRRVKINKERQVITYAELWHTSWSLLKQGQDQEKGSIHQFMGSLVFTAFSFEAYLNHIGPRVFRNWEALERLGPKEKLDIIAEKIGLPVEYGKRPWGIMKELFGFRNEIAHGKSIKVAEEQIVPLSMEDVCMRGFAKTEWERFCTRQNAERARKNVEEMVKALHAKAEIKDESPFIGGSQEALASLLEERSEKRS